MSEKPEPVKPFVVIPAYNESGRIRHVIESIDRTLVNIIVVDDASNDNTVAEIEDLQLEIIRHTANQGKACSLQSGFRLAIERGAEYIISMDADGQHNGHDIPKLLQAAMSAPQKIIIAARLKKTYRAKRARYIANKIADFWLSWACGYRIFDSQSGFRIYPAGLVKRLTLKATLRKSFIYESEVLIRAASLGYQGFFVAVEMRSVLLERASYFKPGRDVFGIFIVVAIRLLSKFLYLNGLWRSLSDRRKPQY